MDVLEIEAFNALVPSSATYGLGGLSISVETWDLVPRRTPLTTPLEAATRAMVPQRERRHEPN